MEDELTRGKPLCLEEREEISRGVAVGESGRRIAARGGRHFSVVGREVGRNGGRVAYRAHEAQQDAAEAARRPKERKLERQERLCAEVDSGLRQRWSPGQIAVRFQADFPDDAMMRVSREAIYQALFVQAKGQLKTQLARRLRAGKLRRVSRVERRAVIARFQVILDMVVIVEWPVEVVDRAVPGCWEGDLIMGKGDASAIITLVERTSRYSTSSCSGLPATIARIGSPTPSSAR